MKSPRSVKMRLLQLVVCLLLLLQYAAGQSLGELKKMPRPPEMILEPPQSEIYKIGEDLKLDCRASGEPAPSYYWEFNLEWFDINGQDNRVTQQPNEGTIVFNNPLKKDEGVYQCFARNQHGTAASQKVVLNSAQLDEFPPSKSPDVMTASVGSSVRLSCIPPKSIPSNPEIAWEKFYPFTGDIQPVILSNRISLDSYGNLYFVSIKKEDELVDDGEYRCSVFNNIQRKSVAGMRYQIRVTGVIALSAPPELMWATQDNRPVGLRGQKLILKCIFSGEPIPKVIWTRESPDGAKMGTEPRVTTDSFGQELVFNSVEFDDAGRYQCGGSNSQAANTVTKPFDLRVESKPYWVTKPKNYEVGEGETVSFVCEAGGIPKPDINWFINGKPLEKAAQNPRRMSIGGNITFTSVTTDDAQVVQCNASNIYGYVFSNAYLNVIRSEPIWKVPPPPQIIFAEGQTKNLTCETYAGPRADVSWVKDGVYLTGGRHVVHRDGNLEIQNIVTTDAGTYTCTAKNQMGQLQGTSIVRVSQPTQIVTKPQDLIITAGKEAKFICTATTDPSLINDMEIIWKKYTNVIDAAQSGRVFQNLMDNSLVITDVNEQDAALYTCVARTNLDQASAMAFLKVRDVPNAPEIKEVKCKSNRTAENKINYFAEIRFTPKGANYAPINKFTVESQTDFERDAWSVIHTTDSTNPAEIPLSPYGNYTFRVIAWNFIGESEPSPPSTTVCRTEPDAPSVQPKNVKAEGSEPDNMVISWTPILPIEHNGAGFKYEIEWNCTDADCQTDPNTRGQATISVYTENKHVVRDLPPFHRFMVKVTCRNENGISTAPAVPIVGYSGEFKPTKAPEGLQVADGSVGSSTATLKWVAIKDTTANIGGFLVGYVVRFFRKEEGLARVRYELIQLNDPEERFKAPSTHEPHGDLSTTRKRRSVVTLSDLGLGGVGGGFVSMGGLVETHRRDKRDVGYMPGGRGEPGKSGLSGFVETHRRDKRDVDIVRNADDELVVTMNNLPPNSDVELSVAVFNTRYYGPFSKPVSIRTKEGPPGPVDYFAVRRRNANMIKVEWTPPVDPNGVIIGYDFAHREIRGLNLGDRSWDVSVTDPNARHHNISGLKPEQMYRVYIYAKTIAGRGEENFLDVATTGAGAPQPPQFDVNNITDHTMNVTWVPSSMGNPGSVFYVQYRKSGKTEWEVSATETENLHVELLSLSAGTSYEVRVVAQNGYTAEAASVTKWFSTTGSTNSLSFVVGEPWFIMMFLVVIILVVVLVILVVCREKLSRKEPPSQEEEHLNYEQSPPDYHTGGGYNRSGESLHKHPPEQQPMYAKVHSYGRDRGPRDYPEKDPDRDFGYDGDMRREPSREWSDREPSRDLDGRDFSRERSGRRPSFEEGSRVAPADYEPSPVMFMPSDDRGPMFAPPPRYSESMDADYPQQSHDTSTEV